MDSSNPENSNPQDLGRLRNLSKEHYQNCLNRYHQALCTFAEKTQKHFDSEIIPSLEPILQTSDHKLVIAWDFDNTLVTWGTITWLPPMRDLFQYLHSKGFRCVIITGGRDAHDFVRQALDEISAPIASDAIHSFPYPKIEHTAKKVAEWKTSVRKALADNNHTVIATFDDLYENLFCQITKNPLPHTGIPFHVPPAETFGLIFS